MAKNSIEKQEILDSKLNFASGDQLIKVNNLLLHLDDSMENSQKGLNDIYEAVKK